MMTARNASTVLLAAALVSWLAAGSVEAQTIIEGQSALDNSRGGAIAARAPGNMVNAGLARATAFAASGVNIEITQTARETSIWAQALADSIATVFNQLNQGIFLFHNLLLARAGRPPVIPTTILPATSGGGSSAGGTGGSINLGGLDLGGLNLGGLLDQFGGGTIKKSDTD